MDDEWMFEMPGAIGARLEKDPASPAGGGEGSHVLVFKLVPTDATAPAAEFGEDITRSQDLPAGLTNEEAADTIEQRLSRHFDVKRIQDPRENCVCEWALSERSASPGLIQPAT
jgi:hypothetical protein